MIRLLVWCSTERTRSRHVMAKFSSGSPNRQHLLDYVLEDRPGSGPFATIKQFHDWFSRLPWLPFPNHESFQDPWRASLPDTGETKLTHGDLHRGNIIVSSTGPPRVLAVVDWAHCGWYPDYWEYCKAAYTSSYKGEWRNRWVPMFIEPWVKVHETFADYIQAMGAIWRVHRSDYEYLVVYM